MSETTGSRNLTELLGDMLTHVTRLLRQEINLARAERRESLRTLNRQLLLIALAGALGLLGMACVVGFVVVSLWLALHRLVSPPVALSLALLIVGLALLLSAFVLMRQSVERIKEGWDPQRTDKHPTQEITPWQPQPHP